MRRLLADFVEEKEPLREIPPTTVVWGTTYYTHDEMERRVAERTETYRQRALGAQKTADRAREQAKLFEQETVRWANEIREEMEFRERSIYAVENNPKHILHVIDDIRHILVLIDSEFISTKAGNQSRSVFFQRIEQLLGTGVIESLLKQSRGYIKELENRIERDRRRRALIGLEEEKEDEYDF